MKTLPITALQRFSHGRLNMDEGQTDKIEAGEARELEKAGLVAISDTEPAEDDDLLGEGEKMAPITSNKMIPAPRNKTTKG